MTTFIEPAVVKYSKKYCGGYPSHTIGTRKCKCDDCALGRFIGAVGRNDLSCVESLLHKNPDLLDKRLVTRGFADPTCSTPVLFSGHMKVETALIRAMHHQRTLMFDHLLVKGCDPNTVVQGHDGLDSVALLMAFRLQATPFMITRLLGVSDLSFCTPNNDNIFHVLAAASHGYSPYGMNKTEGFFSIIRQRQEAGDPIANVNQVNSHGKSPLIQSLLSACSDYFIEQLIGLGANTFPHPTEETYELLEGSGPRNRLERLQKPERIYAASCARDLGTTPDGKHLVWKKLPDEVWRHMGSFL